MRVSLTLWAGVVGNWVSGKIRKQNDFIILLAINMHPVHLLLLLYIHIDIGFHLRYGWGLPGKGTRGRETKIFYHRSIDYFIVI